MSAKDNIKYLGEKIKKLLFNDKLTCNLCGKENFNGLAFCSKCESQLALNNAEICHNCGRSLKIFSLRCASCEGSWSIDKARSAFVYTKAVPKLILQMKYYDKKYLAEIFAEYLKTVYIENYFAPDIITFVPMTDRVKYMRGYNQSEALAKALAKSVNNKAIATLIKQKETENQKGLDYKKRQSNLKGAFKAIDKNILKDKKVLLVDDVLTTGATSSAAAEVLKKAGAKSVYLLTVASVSKEF